MQVSMIAAPGMNDGMESPMSLDARFTAALAREYVDAGATRGAIEAASTNVEVVTNPEQLFRLQVLLQEYSKQMSITAALAKHATDGIKNLLSS
ncbi:MAG TPA: type III secretion system inner rod subunit SctI [Dyella sp.]|uniref:type III secretion system inner rod subunit SctI n=1 Tax=Dyella sp. TaxID=1869338 RepID=UPI002F92006D